MRIRRVQIDGFMHHACFDLELPDAGIVLVTGPNGAGKSAIVEAVAECIWGETLRGRRWKRPYLLHVAADRMQFERADSGKDRVKTSIGHFDTPAKAQEAITAAAGSFELWRRSHVFSSADAAHFTTSADGARKELIETILGAARFDVALKACAADLSAATVTQTAADRELQRLAGSVGVLRQDCVALVAEPYADFQPRVSDEELAAGEERLRATQQAAAPANTREGDWRPRPNVEAARAELRQASAELSGKKNRVLQASLNRCHACGQPLASEVSRFAALGAGDLVQLELNVDTAEQELELLERAAADWDTEQRQAAVDMAKARAAQQLASVDFALAIRELRELQELRAEDQRIAAERAAWAARRAGAQRKLADTELALMDAEDTFAAVSEAVTVLAAASDALGPRGARVAVLSDALRGVESLANVWLAKLCGDEVSCRIELGEDTRERGQRAGTVDLSFDGFGDGGYKSLSGGQRRRADIALMLALAEVAGLASGREPGTLWIDEAFDTLDEDGVAAAQAALVEVARERCVVVITHSEAVIAGMGAVKRVQVGA